MDLPLYHMGRDVGRLEVNQKQLSKTSSSHGKRLDKIELRLAILWRLVFLVAVVCLQTTGQFNREAIAEFIASQLKRVLMGGLM